MTAGVFPWFRRFVISKRIINRSIGGKIQNQQSIDAACKTARRQHYSKKKFKSRDYSLYDISNIIIHTFRSEGAHF